MKMPYLFIIFIVVVGSIVLFSQCTYNETHNHYYNPIVKTDLTTNEIELVRLINEYRISNGLNPLIPEVLASYVCEQRNISDIERNVYPSHEGWSDMLIDAQVQPNNGSQILGYNFLTPLGLFNAYKSSERHNQVLLTENATHIGTNIIDRRNYSIIVKY